MIKIVTKKRWNQIQDYISHLEIKIINLNKAYEAKKKEYDELESKYKRLKMEAFLKGVE